MSERADHVAAIRERPECDTTRLVYADWLDEQPHPLDLDRATAQYIRLTCGPRADKGDAGVWLWLHWHRLVPNLVREHTPEVPAVFSMGYEHLNHSTIVAWPRLCRARGYHGQHEREPFRTVRVQLRFARGFLDVWSVRKDWRAMLETVLAVDQPLAVPRAVKGRAA